MQPFVTLFAREQVPRVRADVVATGTRFIQVVLHIEGDAEPAFTIRFGDRSVAQRAGCPRRIPGHPIVRIQRLVRRSVVAFETVLAGAARRPVSQKPGVLETVLDPCMLALVDDIVTSRAYDLAAF